MTNTEDPRDATRDAGMVTPAYGSAEANLPSMTDEELEMLVAGVVAELVNRGNDHDTAVEIVQDAAHAGAEGSRTFDALSD